MYQVYGWDATQYSLINAISSFIHPITMTFAVMILIKKLKLDDINLSIIGMTGLIFGYIIRGSTKSPIGYYISVLLASIGSVVTIGMRSKLSKIVNKDELGKVFSLVSTFETIAPTISSLIYTFIFSFSINIYPGLVFHFSALFLIIPIVSMMWINFRI